MLLTEQPRLNQQVELLNPNDLGRTDEELRLTAGLDYYKATMSQFAYGYEPNAEVTYQLKNRGQQVLADYVDPDKLQDRLDERAERGFKRDELSFLGSLENRFGGPVFSYSYLSFLARTSLPAVKVELNQDIEVSTTGPWPLATFWETIVMSELSQNYFEGYLDKNNIDPSEIFAEGDRRLDEKIDFFMQNPDIKLAEFGTRRRFSYEWQRHVYNRLRQECPANIVGTSNIALAQAEESTPIGTYAHELPMVYAGLAGVTNLKESQARLLDNWSNFYGPDLAIFLPDTFTSNFFLKNFGKERAEQWRGGRQDSGDPIVYGNKIIDFYKPLGIDPMTKSVLFSDSLSTPKIAKIHETFKDRIGNISFGVGTDLTNDLGLKALNIVMKAESVNGTPVVKLSDEAGKHSGQINEVRRYQKAVKD
jgi:nicotinate phosphoribosyltransferase